MIRIDPKFYRVGVILGDKAAHHIVVAYNLDTARKSIGMEFYCLVSSMDDSAFMIIAGHTLSFKEQLRVLGQATEVCEHHPRTEEEKLIKLKMKEAYAEDAEIEIEKIRPE